MGAGQSRDLARPFVTSYIQLSSAAQQDIATAKQWYVDRLVPDLDLRFLQELERIFTQIESFPAGFPVVYKDVRKASLHRFPYSVFYHRRGDNLYILAVVHHARHPNVWKKRR